KPVLPGGVLRPRTAPLRRKIPARSGRPRCRRIRGAFATRGQQIGVESRCEERGIRSAEAAAVGASLYRRMERRRPVPAEPRLPANSGGPGRNAHHQETLFSGQPGGPKSAACGMPPRRAYRPCWRRGRVAEGGGLLNRYRLVKAYRGFESLRLRHPPSLRFGAASRRSFLAKPGAASATTDRFAEAGRCAQHLGFIPRDLSASIGAACARNPAAPRNTG